MACSPVDVPRREAAIAQALANKLEQRAKDRAEAAAKVSGSSTTTAAAASARRRSS